MEASQKLKIEVPYDPTSPFLDIYSNKMKALTGKDIHALLSIAALFTIAKT